MRTFRKLVSEVTIREGGKSQAKEHDIRSALSHLADIAAEQMLSDDVLFDDTEVYAILEDRVIKKYVKLHKKQQTQSKKKRTGAI